jgi:DNA-binding NarL/FixJ family response regulator
VSSIVRTEEEHLAHYGILRRSGRYPWGSGSTQNVRNRSYLDIIEKHTKVDGWSQAEIARNYGITTTQLRAARSIALAQQKQQKILQAERLRDRGWSNVAIGDRMGLNESSVRALLAPGEKEKADALQTTANMLKGQVDKKKYIQVGSGVEKQLGVTKTHLGTAVSVLEEQGYRTHNIKVQQLGTGKFTTVKVLARPGTTLSEVQRNRAEIRLITEYSEDHGRTFLGTQTPISISSKRIAVNYREDGGAAADGVIYVRPGMKDLSIGDNRYGQVRIAVDKTHYLKGMAVYKDDLPEGVDLLYNTNKEKHVPLKSTNPKADQVFKPLEGPLDSDLPFGSIIRQVHGPDGKVISAMNIVGSPTKATSGVEGAWDTWSKNLPSQMLSKQSPDLATQQLNMTYERRQREYGEIKSLTNPTVRKDLLLKFADSTDSAAIHLQAASLPRQATKVLLPVPSMKPTEIYAPSMRHGERVALVRFPHGGTFEIPELTVNNKNPEARRLLGTGGKDGRGHDSVGIHHSVAERLSGADFDGDTVLVIPNNKRLVKHTNALEDLKGFDPMKYKIPDGSPIAVISSRRKGQEMGRISNLITDMSLKGAGTDELARAVRHSMVVIDSEKHKLDFLQSEKDHGILQLKEKYQGGKRRGASTLISRATAEERVLDRNPRRAALGGPIDPRTGEKVYELTGRKRPEYRIKIDPTTGQKVRVETGRMIDIRIKSVKLAETKDAHSLVSTDNTHMERIYADHSNQLKALANESRKEALKTKSVPYSRSAKKTYAHEVETLNAKLNTAEKNAPLEKQAQILANAKVSQIRQNNPNMEEDEVNKVKQVALNEARARTGAYKERIVVTQNEWNAIQAGAISKDKLEKILTNSDSERIKELALPRSLYKMTPTMNRRAIAMLDDGYTQQEVADQLGIGLTTLKVSLSE